MEIGNMDSTFYMAYAIAREDNKQRLIKAKQLFEEKINNFLEKSTDETEFDNHKKNIIVKLQNFHDKLIKDDPVGHIDYFAKNLVKDFFKEIIPRSYHSKFFQKPTLIEINRSEKVELLFNEDIIPNNTNIVLSLIQVIDAYKAEDFILSRNHLKENKDHEFQGLNHHLV